MKPLPKSSYSISNKNESVLKENVPIAEKPIVPIITINFNKNEQIIDLNKDNKRKEIGFETESVLDNEWKEVKVDTKNLLLNYSKLSKKNLTGIIL